MDELSTQARNDVLRLPAQSWSLMSRQFSLDDVLNDDDGNPLTMLGMIADRSGVQPQHEAEHEAIAEYVREALAALSPRERTVLELYYREEKTHEDIGQLIGLSHTRVWQLRRRGLTNMRRILRYRFGITKTEVA